jgi:hypothetical protein
MDEDAAKSFSIAIYRRGVIRKIFDVGAGTTKPLFEKERQGEFFQPDLGYATKVNHEPKAEPGQVARALLGRDMSTWSAPPLSI